MCRLFTSWCGDRLLDPVNCPIGTVLEFLQARFSAGLTHSTLKVYVAAIAAYHAPPGGQSVGRHPLVTHFLRGALKLRPLAREAYAMWWIRMLFYSLGSSDLPSPLGVKAHSTRSVTASKAFLEVCLCRTSATLRDGLRPSRCQII